MNAFNEDGKRHGTWQYDVLGHTKNPEHHGKVFFMGHYDNGVKHGLWIRFNIRDNGDRMITAIIPYVNGEVTGYGEEFHPVFGTSAGYAENNVRVGVWSLEKKAIPPHKPQPQKVFYLDTVIV